MHKIQFFILILLCSVLQAAYSQAQGIPDEWKLGTSSILLNDFTVKSFQKAKKGGISSIEIAWNKFSKDTPAERSAHAELIYRNAKKARLEIWSAHLPYGAAYDISTIDENKRSAIVNSIKEYIDLSSKLKVKQMVIHPSTDRVPDEIREEKLQASRKSLKELAAYAKLKNIGLNVECLPRKCLGNTSTEILRIIEGIPNLGICFDSNHLLQEKPEEFVNAVGNKIKMVHIADYDMVDEKHWMPGRGANNWNKIISALINNHFNGRFMYEVLKRENDTFTISDLKANFKGLIAEWEAGN